MDSSGYPLTVTPQTAFNIKLGMTKLQHLQILDSLTAQATAICGVHVDPETGKQPARCKVENSWGGGCGD